MTNKYLPTRGCIEYIDIASAEKNMACPDGKDPRSEYINSGSTPCSPKSNGLGFANNTFRKLTTAKLKRPEENTRAISFTF
ncbi:MAG: hypothetical protein WC089_04060 [Candidatus Paceibacterota bacterium]